MQEVNNRPLIPTTLYSSSNPSWTELRALKQAGGAAAVVAPVVESAVVQNSPVVASDDDDDEDIDLFDGRNK